MIYLENQIPEKVGYVLPIGDLHFSDKAFQDLSYKKFLGYRDWVLENPNSRVVLGGDMFNVATRGSITSPFGQRMSVNEEMNEIVEILTPIKKQIAGAIEGNHEFRGIDFLDLSLTETLCGKLDIPYMGISGVINFKVGKKRSLSWRTMAQNYYIYFHHTIGGGNTIGGGLNRVEKLGNIMEGVDCYCGFHNHKLSMAKSIIYKPNPDSKRVEERVVSHFTCGGYLQYDRFLCRKRNVKTDQIGKSKNSA